MKHIVLLTDPDRLDVGLLRRLQWVFPECPVAIVTVTEETGRAVHRPPAAGISVNTMDEVTG